MNEYRGAEVAPIILNLVPDEVEWSASRPSYFSPRLIWAGGGVGSRDSLDTVPGQLYFLPMQRIKPWINQLPVQSLYQKQYLDS